ncbi:hypothetical protein UlMin_038181 [Ulmus minor]
MIAIAIVIAIAALVTLTGDLPSTRLNLQPMQAVCLLYIITLGKVSSCCLPNEICIFRNAFELIFAFDEVISLGHKENVTVAQVKQYCEMESHEEKLHKLVMQSKINETKDVMKRKASKIDKSKIEKNRGDKGGFMPSMGSGKIESGFSDMSISSSGSGFESGSSLGLSTNFDSFSTKPKGRQPSAVTALPKGLGMQLGKSQRTNQFLESLKADGSQSRAAAAPLTDPVTLNGRVSNFDVQGTLSLQIINQDDGHIQVQTHPNMKKELFTNENILGVRDPNRPFPASQGGDGVVNYWPSISGNETYVSIEYEASSMFDLQNVFINHLSAHFMICRYDSRNSILEWSILLNDNSNYSGSMEFVVPPANSSMFFPIYLHFSVPNTFNVVNLLPLKGEAPPKFSQRTQLITENYQVL